METGWKERLKKAGWPVLSYVVISLLAAVFAIIRLAAGGKDSGTGVTLWEVVLFLIVPVLFLAAGYLGTAKCGFGKLKAYKVLLFSAVFSALLLGLWYVLLELYVLLNLPAAEGGYALDLWLRKTMITYGYEFTYLGNTDMYRYTVLPLIHFVIRILYWLCYLWGNRIYISRTNRK